MGKKRFNSTIHYLLLRNDNLRGQRVSRTRYRMIHQAYTPYYLTDLLHTVRYVRRITKNLFAMSYLVTRTYTNHLHETIIN